MRVIGISMMHNEIDIVEASARHMASELDELVIADNLSDDGTRQALDCLSGELPLTVIDDSDPAHYQGQKMSVLARIAADRAGNAENIWIVPFDADELWYSPAGRIRDVLAGVPETVRILTAKMFDHVRTAVDEDAPTPFQQMVWRRRESGRLPKIAFQYESGAIIEDGNHGVRLPSGVTLDDPTKLVIRHFQYRSADQFIRKIQHGAAALAMTDLPIGVGVHWRGYGRILREHGVAGLKQAYGLYHWHLAPWESGLVLDPAPYLQNAHGGA